MQYQLENKNENHKYTITCVCSKAFRDIGLEINIINETLSLIGKWKECENSNNKELFALLSLHSSV